MKKAIISVLLLFSALSAHAQVPVYDYTIVNTFPHNTGSFTQGFLIHDGYLYEGTGRNGRSSLSKIQLEDGTVLKSTRLGSRYFGEGISIVGDKIFQLTWQSNIVFVYDLNTFESVTSYYHPTEGWGLTWDGEELILSDGSSALQFIDPDTFKVTRTIDVQLEGRPISNLNELEYINGEVWANVWQTNEIVRINPASGTITGIVNLAGLIDHTTTGGAESVLNGIAWVPEDDPEAGKLYVTGKLWGNIFEIEIFPRK